MIIMEGVDSKSKNEAAKNTSERTYEKKTPEVIRQEVLSSIKNGADKEGEQLLNAYKDSIKDPEKSSFAGETYKKAKLSFENIDNAGEINKLTASLDALYRQAGVEEGYLPKIEHEGDLSEEDKQKLMRDRVSEDFQNYPDLYAENKIGRYVDASAKVKEAEGKVAGAVDKDMVSRVGLRKAIYEVQQARTGLYNVIEEEVKQIKGKELGNELVENIKSSLKFEEKPLDKGFDELDKNEKSELFGKSVNEYKSLNSDAHEKHIKAVDNLTDEEKKSTFGKAAALDREIQNKKINLKEAIINDPEKAVELASELRSLQVDKHLRLSEASVAVAKKRSEISKTEWKAAAGKVLSGLLRRKGQKEGVWGKFKASTNEWISSKRDEVGQSIGKDVREVTSELREGLDENADELRVFYEKIDEKFLSRVRSATEKASTKFQNYREDLRDSRAKVEADTERRKVIARKTYYRSKHNTKKSYRESITTIGYGWRSTKETTWMNLIGKFGDIVGDEGIKEDVRHRGEVLSRFERMHRSNIDAIRKSDNPYMDVFKKDLEDRFEFVQKVIEARSQENAKRERKTKEKADGSNKNLKESKKTRPETIVPAAEGSKKEKPEIPTKPRKEKGLSDLTQEELEKRRQQDGNQFILSQHSFETESRGRSWEKTLEKTGDSYLSTLKEVDRRLNERLTEVKIQMIKSLGYDFDPHTLNENMEALLKNIEISTDIEERSKRIEAYSEFVRNKEQSVNRYLGLLDG